jgi:ABC-type nickel/cobalt efflux system permease component RcnA
MLLLTAVLTGLLAGVVHVLTGPDHLAAVAPIAADSRGRAWSAGLMWGIGHSSGTWLLAAVAIAFREAIRVDVVSEWSERVVGVVLIGVGLWALRRVLIGHVHAHNHTHGGVTHVHIHAHAHPHAPGTARPHVHKHGALGIGTLHGLAGTSHLLGILPALALPTRSGAVVYIVAFGVGSIIAMTAFASVLGLVLDGTPMGRRMYRGVMLGTALFAIALGCYWLSAPRAELAEPQKPKAVA